MNEVVKSVAAYGATSALSFLAARYHLTGDQLTAIAADAATVAAVAGGVWMHVQNGKKGEKDDVR